ncbi:microfibril-associated glycoprotein 4-like [Clarias gariepinus]|uniref:microfibril-associated glycoprotein 4-like n=1 Tax=Clarias gariepinus TaxID=13013 RepID=UPI00234D3B11|nr:microfibril-associated glycoprotein 4-like [Clarias gariepinus]
MRGFIMLSWCMLALLLPSLGAAGPVLILPQDCQELYRSGVTSNGVYTIYPSPSTPVDVYCEISCTDDCDAVAGWTVIQRRMDGSVGFYRNWETYKNGFGNKSGEYWLGLDNLHLMTNNKLYELRIDLEDFDGLKSSAVYTTFIVGPESNSYTLQIGGFINHGAGDSLSYHNGQKFSTYDNENNNYGYYCGTNYFSGFWFNGCFYGNPNGLYLGRPYSYSPYYYYYYYYYYYPGIVWGSWRGWNYSLKGVTMKIRPFPHPPRVNSWQYSSPYYY